MSACPMDNVEHFAEKLQAARLRRDAHLVDVETMAHWKLDLEHRIGRAQLRFNHVDVFTKDFDELVEEVEDFRLIAFALGGQTK